MTYAVKTLYPEFKCLTAFRKVMKRIETYNNRKGTMLKGGIYVYNQNRYATAVHYEEQRHNSCYQEYFRALKKKDEDFLSEKWDEYINYYTEDARGDKKRFTDACVKNCPELYIKGENGEYRWTNKGLKEKWFMNEANKYDMMAKKWEFNEAMISRDYKTITLCDDVIGVVFEYL